MTFVHLAWGWRLARAWAPDPGDEGRHSIRRWVPRFAGDCSESNALPVTVGGGDSF